MFFSAFVIAISVQSKLALITLSLVPVVLIMSVVCVGIDAVLESWIVPFYSQGAGMVQENLSTLKTVHAFDIADCESAIRNGYERVSDWCSRYFDFQVYRN